MAYYRLYYFRPRIHGIVRFEDLKLPDDEAAVEAARAKRGEYALELWRGATRVAEIPATDLVSRLLAKRVNGNQPEGISP